METYNFNEVAYFCRVTDEFGGFSNFAGGFLLLVNNQLMRTSEALYQVIRYTDHPDIQREIIDQKSPMAAKMKAKKYYSQTRSDWEEIKSDVMYWTLRVKLLQNRDSFGEVLNRTKSKPIVEISTKGDTYWGTSLEGKQLIGNNELGKLLMKLRDNMNFTQVEPLRIPNFKLFGKEIETVNE